MTKEREMSAEPARPDVNVRTLLRYVEHCVEDATEKFIGAPNDERTRKQLSLELVELSMRIMNDNGVKLPTPDVEVDIDAKKPTCMVVTFRRPDTGEVIPAAELPKYLGLAK